MKDQLSALIDGEFEIESSEHIITSVKSGGELKEAWQHYHLIGDAMRGDISMRHDFSMRVMQALDAEPTVLATNKAEAVTHTAAASQTYKLSMFKNGNVWSIAASVAAVMFVGLMVLQQQLFRSVSVETHLCLQTSSVTSQERLEAIRQPYWAVSVQLLASTVRIVVMEFCKRYIAKPVMMATAQTPTAAKLIVRHL